MNNLPGSGAWKMHLGQDLRNMGDVYRSCLWSFGVFFLWNWNWELKRGVLGWEGRANRGSSFSWVLISKAWHGHNGPGNDLEGACGLLPSDYFQGRFRYDNSEEKGVDPLPPHSSVVLTSIHSGLSMGAGHPACLSHIRWHGILPQTPLSALSNTLKKCFLQRTETNPKCCCLSLCRGDDSWEVRVKSEQFVRNACGWQGDVTL